MAPNAWMARSTTRSATFGATTLMAAISVRAPLLPTVSISHAALSVSSRACSISMRLSAIHSRITPCSASGLPNATRLVTRSAHQLERPFGHADRPHAVVDASGPEPCLGDRETATLGAEHVRRRHPDVGEGQLAVPLAVLVAEDLDRTDVLDPGGVHGHQHHRLLQVARRVGVGLAHDDEDLAPVARRTRDEPLVAVDHVVVAVASDRALDVGGVARGDGRLGHREGRADLAGRQRLQPSLLLLGRAEHREDLHVPGVGRRAVARLGARGASVPMISASGA